MKNFILIDDNRLDNLVNTKVVEKSGLALSIKVFTSAIDALEYFLEVPLVEDLIILVDVQMPMMNGFEFLEKLNEKRKDITDSAQIYMLSSSIHENDTEQAAEFPFVTKFLHKPFTEAIQKVKEFNA